MARNRLIVSKGKSGRLYVNLRLEGIVGENALYDACSGEHLMNWNGCYEDPADLWPEREIFHEVIPFAQWPQDIKAGIGESISDDETRIYVLEDQADGTEAKIWLGAGCKVLEMRPPFWSVARQLGAAYSRMISSGEHEPTQG